MDHEMLRGHAIEKGHESIVVGLTASPASRSALDWAARYARRTGARLLAVCVHPAPDACPEDNTSPDARSDWTAESRRTIEAVFSAAHPSPEWTLIHLRGDPGPDLVDKAKDADLLVIGRHLAQPDHQRAEVANYCANAAPVPVVIVPAAPVTRTGAQTSPRHQEVASGAIPHHQEEG